ncbi:hypothetical protein PRUPE_4G199200 [Prunus persica]|uniref:Uncharacterized protein n=1 Tax=Prunus persica TaxID=3760 RepID=A0A251PN82_PRUPE|nr:hypothetical protein PRUPE_4G199200 [Prunus persica]ONI13036.1 hypothetical protein PRUPE_4G199200 [Prunus persica]
MSAQVLAAYQVQSLNATPDHVKRRLANFSPSTWGDYFLSYASVETDIKAEQDVQELKEKVKGMIMAPMLKNPSKKLELIDEIQRFGVSRHFENEVEEVLQQIHKNSYGGDEENDFDLFTTALRFRLLRQHGYEVSCNMFNKFKDEDGKFKETLVDDVVGLLSLYESTHLRMHGEDLLDEALTFTTTHLESVEAHRLSPLLAKQVTHALYQPFWKGCQRPEARRYLAIFEEEPHPANETLLTLAKLDFNLVQQVHQKELSEISRWDISAMDQLPEYMKVCYGAMLDVYTEFEEKLGKEGNLYRIHYAREAMKCHVRGYFDEAKWLHQKYTPTMDEYMAVALGTSYKMPLTTSFIGMRDIVTKESLDWVLSDPKIVNSLSILGRLMDDMKSHKFEQKREHVASVVECYMKEYGATEEETIIELGKQVNKAWKDINEGWINLTTIPMPLRLRILNFARTNELMYKHEDAFTHAGVVLKDLLVSLFVNPVPI